MDSSLIAKQMTDFQKTAFDGTFNAIVMLQDHTETVANTFFEQAAWFPEEGKRIIAQWTEMFKKGRNEVKTAVDDNFSKMTESLSSAQKVPPKGDSAKTNKRGRQ